MGESSSDASYDTQAAHAIEAMSVNPALGPDEMVASTSAAGDMRRVELTPLLGLSQHFTLQMEHEIQRQIQEQSRKLVQKVLHQSTNQVMPPPSSEAAQASLHRCFQMASATSCLASAQSPESGNRSTQETAQYSHADPFARINPPPPEVLRESCPASQSNHGRTATCLEPTKENYPRMKRREGVVPTPGVKLNQNVATLVVLNPPGTFPISEVDTLTRLLCGLLGNRKLWGPCLS